MESSRELPGWFFFEQIFTNIQKITFLADNLNMAEKITKADLVEQIFRNTNLPKKEIALVVDSLLDEVKEALSKGASIELRNFGTFEVRLRKGRQNAQNPKTGQKVSSQPHYVAAFRAGRELKNNLWSLKV